MVTNRSSTTRTTILISLTLSLASLGDTLLYPVLSSDYQTFGVSLYWVGILLSVNRFVRLVANRVVAYAIQVLGLHRSSVWAAVIASVTTILYGISHQLIILLVARVGWGIAYATLRINTIHQALAGEKKGLLLGLSGALYEIGPLLALGVGPSLIRILGIPTTFVVMGLLSLTAVYLAWQLPQNIEKRQEATIEGLSWPNRIEQLVFWVATVVEGGLVVMMATLFLEVEIRPEKLIMLTALYLIIRRMSGLLLSPLVGWLADRLGLKKVFVAILIGLIIALGLISVGIVEVGIAACFVMARMFATLSPAMAIRITPEAKRLPMLASLTTWRDLGAAVGALLGLIVLQMTGATVLFGITAFIIFIYTLWIIKNEH
ncbi:MAG TPA: hypothetical protein DCS93_44120 [Microscillaceae bacterium]|nr:hypothetical protein [Microscillaceae bacterium]